MGLILAASWVGIAATTLAFSLLGGVWRRVYFLNCLIGIPGTAVYIIESGTRWDGLEFFFLYPFFVLQAALVVFPLTGLYLLYRHFRRRAAARAKGGADTGRPPSPRQTRNDHDRARPLPLEPAFAR